MITKNRLLLASLAVLGAGASLGNYWRGTSIISANTEYKPNKKMLSTTEFQIGAKQAERYRKQALRNVEVNGFSLIQRG